MMLLAVALLTLLLTQGAAAGAAPAPDLRGFAFEAKPGSQIPLQATFRDEADRRVRLLDLLQNRPTILVLGYYHCPNLCGVIRADLFNALAGTSLSGGRDYNLVLLSIDPTETVNDASQAKAGDVEAYPLQGAAFWHYLTGPPEAIDAVSQAVGFRHKFDPKQKQFVHPAGLVMLSPDGRVSGYLLGVGYESQDLTRAMERARAGGIAKPPLPVLLLCFHYDPQTGRYSLAIMKLLQLAGAITVLTIGGTLYLAFRRERPPA